MPTIYLYVKTHRKTGLKYLGKTERDPIKYKGSGTYWRRHIKEHGYDVETQILRECQNIDELKEWGLYYSRLWNVVESNEWANLIEENGDGVSSNDSKERMTKLWQDDNFREKQMKMFADLDYRQKIKEGLKPLLENPTYKEYRSEISKKTWENPELHKRRSELSKKMWQNSEYRELQVKLMNERWQDEQFRNKIIENMSNSWTDDRKQKQSEISKANWENQEHRVNVASKISESWTDDRKQKQSEISKARWENKEHRDFMKEKMSGVNHHSYDNTLYKFVNSDGRTEICTKYDFYKKYSLRPSSVYRLVNGERKTHKGWKIVPKQED